MDIVTATSVAFALLLNTAAIIAWSTWKHLKNYRRPDLQRLTLRIIALPLVYALTSWIALVDAGWAHIFYVYILDALCQFYEAFVLWIFLQLMVSFMGGESSLMHALDDGRFPITHSFPLRLCLAPMDLSDHQTFVRLKRGILQFVIVKPMIALLAVILKAAHVYRDGVIAFDSAYMWCSLITNISVCISLYCLAMFYLATRHDLAQHEPCTKFLCIKSVLFLTFWQGVLLAVLAKLDLISSESAVRTQNFLICLEMLIISLVHLSAFSHRPYQNMHSARLSLKPAVWDLIGVNDILLEMKHTWHGTDLRQTFDGRHYYRALTTDSETFMNASGQHVVDLEHSAGDTDGNSIHFPDVNPVDQVESQYIDAMKLTGGDYNYDVQ